MSYAVRNTIILLIALFMIAGAAFVFIQLFQKNKLEELQSQHVELQQDYNSKKTISDNYAEMHEAYQSALTVINNYNKSLFEANDPDMVFDYLNMLSSSQASSQVFFNFTFNDSTSHGQYGIINSSINGYATFTNFLNFLNKLENSQMLNKIQNLSLSPPGGDDLNDITFNFGLQSYYERTPIQEIDRSAGFKINPEMSAFNPFYPLILTTLPANEENLINIEQSRIIGLTGSRAFIIDQNGNVHSLRKGDKVYLGELQQINLNAKTATFNLNKGGIAELVTLEIVK